MKRLTSPLRAKEAEALKAGDRVLLSGTVYTARDAAHIRMANALAKGEKLPFDIKGQTIYYAGPTPTPKGKAIGSIGPTTSTRMDAHTPLLLSMGLRAMIGKGKRSNAVVKAMGEQPCVYFAAIGGAAALMASCITHCKVIAYDDLGPESIKKLEVKDLPLVVAVDCHGNDYYEIGQKDYRKMVDK